MKIPAALLLLNLAFVLANDLTLFSNSNKEFSANIYKELAAGHSGNFVGCPMSTEIVLSLVHAGARKQTAEQLAHGLSLPNSNTEINAMMSTILPKLKSEPNMYTLKTVNKMYVDKDLKISKEFSSTAVDVFQSSVENVDFKNKEEAVSKINGWVEEHTDHKIKNLIDTGDITSNTKAILLNALYFQGKWINSFKNTKTKKANFHTNKIGEVEVDMMDTTDSFEFHQCGFLKAKFLKMPYISRESLTMVVILPNEKDGLDHVEANIKEALEAQKFTRERVHVNFPKFKMDATIKFIPILEKLGVVDLFKPTADLSGITSDGAPLYISDVIQKNYIEVNEQGTIAASATAAIAGFGSAFNPAEPKEFIADHPFLYYIQSDAGILFVGRYAGH